jgi:HAMP domain-containing protein
MKTVLQAFERLSLSRKLASLLTVIFLASLVVVISLLNVLFTTYAVKEIDRKSSFFIDSMSAVRQYTDEKIDPILSPLNATSTDFLAESIPYYSATQVFSYLQANPDYAKYSYREAALNPTNPKDQADQREAQIIRAFRADPSLKVLTGNRMTAEGMQHYLAKPIRVDHQKCLGCHSTYQRAPLSMIKTYGKTNGFGWHFGEVVGAQIISVPIDAIYKDKQDSLTLVGLLNIGAFVVTAAALLLFLSRVIVKPMRAISSRAFEASLHPENIDFSEKQRQDEIGLIAQSFDRMKQSLSIAMRMLKHTSGDPPQN